MTWSVSTGGHVDDEATERKTAKDLQNAARGAGATYFSFVGNHVNVTSLEEEIATFDGGTPDGQ